MQLASLAMPIVMCPLSVVQPDLHIVTPSHFPHKHAILCSGLEMLLNIGILYDGAHFDVIINSHPGVLLSSPRLSALT